MAMDGIEGIEDRLIDYTSALPTSLKYVRQDHVMEYFNDSSVMEMERTNFLDILSDNTFHVPKYQRLYSWNSEQHEELWESASSVFELEYTQDGNTGRMVATNSVADIFFGTFFLADKSNKDRMEVIDGQQRITTGLLLLSAIQKKLSNIDSSEKALSERKKTSTDQIDNLIYSSPDDQLEREGAITYENNANNKLFYALVSGEDEQVHWLENEEEHEDGRRASAVKAKNIARALDITDLVKSSSLEKYIYHPESNRKMLSGYKYYEEKIEEKVTPLNDEKTIRLLINLKNYVLRSFTIGKVYIHKGSSPELRMGIFQAINDRGKPLSNTDKIRARIANLFSESEQEGQYTAKWESIVKDFGTDDDRIEEFLKTYIAAYEPNISKMAESSKHMMEVFGLRKRDSYLLNPKLVNQDTAAEFLDHLEEHVELYLDIDNPEKDQLSKISEENREEFQEIISRLRSLGTSQWKPLILRAYHKINEDQDKEIIDLLELVENIFLRLAFSDMRANNFEETFPTVADKLENNSLPKAQTLLVEQARDDASSLFGDTFGDIIVESTGLSNGDAKILLYKLASKELDEISEESAVRQEMKDEGVDPEHVLPKTMVNNGDNEQFLWFNCFFPKIEFHSYRLEELNRHLENDQLYDTIKRYFIQDIGNVILLEEGLNRSIKNKPFSVKIERYYDDELFEEVTVNNFFTDKNPLFRQGNLDKVEENSEFWDNFWNVEKFKERRKDILERFLNILEVEDNEFENVYSELESKVEDEVNRRAERVKAECQ